MKESKVLIAGRCSSGGGDDDDIGGVTYSKRIGNVDIHIFHALLHFAFFLLSSLS